MGIYIETVYRDKFNFAYVEKRQQIMAAETS
jgi:hypothetical protein